MRATVPLPPPPLNRDAVASALSAMAFRTVDPGRALNQEDGIFGDEAESLLERVCVLYGIDPDLFWSKVDLGRYFEPEQNWLLFPVWALTWALWRPIGFFWSPKPREDGREPFTIDQLVQVLQACLAERAARRTDGQP